MLGWLPFLLFAAAGLNILLGSVVLARDWRQLINRVFFVLTITVALWDVGIGAFLLVQGNVAAFAWAKVFYASALLLVLLLVYFAQAFPGEKRLSPGLTVLLSLPVFALVLLLYTWPEFITQSVAVTEFGKSVTVNQVEYLVYSLVIITYFTISLFELFTKSRKLKGTYRRQAWWFFIAGAVTAAIGLWFDLILPHWLGDYSLVWVGPLATTIFAISCAVSIIRHGLFDIRLATMRAIAYAMTIITLAALYFILAFVIANVFLGVRSDGSWVTSTVNVSVALVLAFIFQPIKQFFDKVTNAIFYHDTYNSGEFFARLTKKISSINELYELLRYTATDISTTLKAEFASFSVAEKGHRPISSSVGKKMRLPVDDLRMLDDYISEQDKVVVTNELTAKHQQHVKKMLDSHRIAVVLPISYDETFKSYLFLGDHLSSRYTTRDIRLLETISGELNIAIRNALSIHEVKELNAHLEQRINEATRELRASNAQLQKLDEAKDEFISMASHQLRTPLTSIKGYISMMADGDVGKITEQQKHILQEAFVSSERMVRLISDFLNVSRLQTGKFLIEKRDTDRAKVVKQEIESLEQAAKTRDLKFTVSVPKKMPTLSLDENKIRQVIMNFADNAIYYSKEKSTIKVSLKADKKDVWFSVKDTGIGVPESEQANLFSKFFRATNARKQRPDGTGVGLFLTKKVISAHHGEVLFESKEGKGSTFGFRLPIGMLRAANDADQLKK
jgi:signal transduction histidine kinase